jgi:hypothetical protein
MKLLESRVRVDALLVSYYLWIPEAECEEDLNKKISPYDCKESPASHTLSLLVLVSFLPPGTSTPYSILAGHTDLERQSF